MCTQVHTEHTAWLACSTAVRDSGVRTIQPSDKVIKEVKNRSKPASKWPVLDGSPTDPIPDPAPFIPSLSGLYTVGLTEG